MLILLQVKSTGWEELKWLYHDISQYAARPNLYEQASWALNLPLTHPPPQKKNNKKKEENKKSGKQRSKDTLVYTKFLDTYVVSYFHLASICHYDYLCLVDNKSLKKGK